MTTDTILYVDDEDDIRVIVAMAIGLDASLKVHCCSSGLEALEKASSLQPQLILLDVMMPGMDGPTTLGKLREKPETAEIPIVFITARTQPHDVDRLMQLGARGIIAKPFDPMTLAATVRSFL